jgi:hypothetical protein
MSVTANGQDISCDVFGCKNIARIAVGLRPAADRAAPVEGWLFLCQDGLWRHFCPECARAYLSGENARAAGEEDVFLRRKEVRRAEAVDFPNAEG